MSQIILEKSSIPSQLQLKVWAQSYSILLDESSHPQHHINFVQIQSQLVLPIQLQISALKAQKQECELDGKETRRGGIQLVGILQPIMVCNLPQYSYMYIEQEERQLQILPYLHLRVIGAKVKWIKHHLL